MEPLVRDAAAREWKMILMWYLKGDREEIEDEVTSSTVHLPEMLGILSKKCGGTKSSPSS
jgi:hypothetical protein